MNNKNLMDIHKESEKITDFEKTRDENLINREKFLIKFPTMQDWLEKWEKAHGAFIWIASMLFTDDRCLFLYKFESAYFCDFHNPLNKDTETHITLSYEAMNGFLTLYQSMKTDEDTRRFWTAIGVEESSIEEYLKQEKTVS